MWERLRASFRHAWKGLKTGWQREYNLRVFTLVSLGVVGAMVGFKTSFLENAVLVLTMSVMLSLELLNSQIEKFLDIVSPQKNYLVKYVKDLSAGAVLVSAVGAVVIGVLIFFPYLLKYFQ